MTKARPGHIDLAEVGSDEVGTAEWYPPKDGWMPPRPTRILPGPARPQRPYCQLG